MPLDYMIMLLDDALKLLVDAFRLHDNATFRSQDHAFKQEVKAGGTVQAIWQMQL